MVLTTSTSHLQSSVSGDWDVVVVGAGLGGLTAAAYLAANGRRPLVLEQWDVAGGCSHVFRRRRKYEFDVGVHYLGDCQPDGTIPTILRGLGLDGKIDFLPMDPDGFDTLVFPDLTFRVPRGWDDYLAALIAAFPADERGLRACVRVFRQLGRAFDRSTTPETPWESARFVARNPGVAYWSMRSLQVLLDSCGLSTRAQAVVCGQSGDYGVAPARVPAAVHAFLLNHYIKTGAYFPKGGGQVLAAHLIDVITSHGGSIQTNTRVARICVTAGRTTGVLLADGRFVPASVVVSNADIKRTYLELVGPEHLPARLVRKVDGYRMAPPFFIVYLGLDMDLECRMPNTNYWVHSSTSPGSFFRGLRTAGDGQTPTVGGVFISSASVKDPDSEHVAPPGCAAVELMSYVSPDYSVWNLTQGPARGERYHRNPVYCARKEQISGDMIELATRVFPDLREHITWQEASTPITQERYTLASAGACLGIELAIDQFGPRRPRSATHIRGLYLAGASNRSGPGIVGVTTSGVIAASAILGRNLFAQIRQGAVFADSSRLTAGGLAWDPLRASRRLASPALRALRVPN
ncbi:phytoene desaturase family protein [Nocardia suismassiliense]|uniref:phytoene desaturase family protein n=1 Tax=Nocardia suismassiliense TaxID=2077092 RepID=UPI00131F2866|nr:NAD(P)/FAD-dependent oxidoreductase [Nocardia suismassiliense]